MAVGCLELKYSRWMQTPSPKSEINYKHTARLRHQIATLASAPQPEHRLNEASARTCTASGTLNAVVRIESDKSLSHLPDETVVILGNQLLQRIFRNVKDRKECRYNDENRVFAEMLARADPTTKLRK